MKPIMLFLLAAILIIQLIPVDRTTPDFARAEDFLTSNKIEVELENILRTSCYDCHSFETKYPWYDRIAPVSWWVQQHINEGREHLNFSIWGDYPAEERDHALEELVEVLEEGEMPLQSYTLMHTNAKISRQKSEQLLSFFQSYGKSNYDTNESKHDEYHEEDDEDDED